jgi:hypothetical protein
MYLYNILGRVQIDLLNQQYRESSESMIQLKDEINVLQQNKNDLMFLGGDKMKNWVESQLGDLRNPIQRTKKVKSNFGGLYLCSIVYYILISKKCQEKS